MNRPYRIFIADWLPLANKGEEALARGISDLLVGNAEVELGLFDNVEEPVQYDNITVFPRKWVYEVSGQWFALSSRERLLKNLRIMAGNHIGAHGRLKNLFGVNSSCPGLKEFFDGSDIVVLGHGPMWCPESAIIAVQAKQRGKKVAVLGAGIAWPKTPYPHAWFMGPMIRFIQEPLYRNAIDALDFCSLRNTTSHQVFSRIARDSTFPKLTPDVAFAMRPAPRSSALDVLRRIPALSKALREGRILVGATTCVASSTYANAFGSVSNQDEKRRVYEAFMAEVFDAIIADRNAFVLFLPHSIEESVGDDVAVARGIAKRMKSSTDRYAVLAEDLSPRVLKSIIRECDAMIGQRAHSLIGATSVATPFVDFTNSCDTRSQEIFGGTCGMSDWIFNLDDPDVAAAKDIVCRMIDCRSTTHARLRSKSKELVDMLNQVTDPLRAGILQPEELSRFEQECAKVEWFKLGAPRN